MLYSITLTLHRKIKYGMHNQKFGIAFEGKLRSILSFSSSVLPGTSRECHVFLLFLVVLGRI